VAAELGPAREAVAGGEVAARLCDAHAPRRGDAVRSALVIVEVIPKRLLEVDPCDVLLQLGPAREAKLARESGLRVGEGGLKA
jgi:hypothetical protein